MCLISLLIATAQWASIPLISTDPATSPDLSSQASNFPVKIVLFSHIKIIWVVISLPYPNSIFLRIVISIYRIRTVSPYLCPFNKDYRIVVDCSTVELNQTTIICWFLMSSFFLESTVSESAINVSVVAAEADLHRGTCPYEIRDGKLSGWQNLTLQPILCFSSFQLLGYLPRVPTALSDCYSSELEGALAYVHIEGLHL